MKRYVAAVLMGLALALPALAADDAQNTMHVPWGDWLGHCLEWSRDLVIAGAGLVVMTIAPTLARQYLTEKVLGRAVDYAIGAVEGAVRGQVLTIPVANEVLRVALQYALANAPGLCTALGTRLHAKLFARIAAAAPVEALPKTAALPVMPVTLRSPAFATLIPMALALLVCSLVSGCTEMAALGSGIVRADAAISAAIPPRATIAATCTLADAADGYFQAIAAQGKFGSGTIAREGFLMDEIHKLCANPPQNTLGVLRSVWGLYGDVQAVTTVRPNER